MTHRASSDLQNHCASTWGALCCLPCCLQQDLGCFPNRQPEVSSATRLAEGLGSATNTGYSNIPSCLNVYRVGDVWYHEGPPLCSTSSQSGPIARNHRASLRYLFLSQLLHTKKQSHSPAGQYQIRKGRQAEPKERCDRQWRVFITTYATIRYSAPRLILRVWSASSRSSLLTFLLGRWPLGR